MFIKLITSGGEESLYECDTVHTHRAREAEEDILVLNLEGKGGSVHLNLGSRPTDIYYMNDNGRTIDSLMWQPK